MQLSVILPTFRREKELAEAINSALGIRDLTLELLVGDDSPDHSAFSLLEGFRDARLKFERMNPVSGGFPGRVRNHLAVQARGKYLYFLDDDDRVNGPALSSVIREMDAHNGQVAVADVCPFGTNPTNLAHEKAFFREASSFLRHGVSPRRMAAQILFKNTVYVCSACVIRRDAYEMLGGFDDAMTPFEDTEFYLRAMRAFTTIYVPVPLLERRCSETCLSAQVSRESILACYQRMRAKYRKTYGIWEYGILRVMATSMGASTAEIGQ